MANENSVSVERWIEMCKNGSTVPVKTYIDGNSMEPLIRKNKNSVTIIPAGKKIFAGNIVLFKSGGKYILHRVIRVDGDTVNTCGDNCIFPDKPLKKNDICGIAVSVEKYGLKLNLDCKIQYFYGKIWHLFFRKYYTEYRKIRNKLHFLIKNKGN